MAISHFQYYRNRKSREYLISIINKLDPPGLPKYGLPLLVAKQIAGFLWDFKWSNPAPPPIKDSYEIRRFDFCVDQFLPPKFIAGGYF